MAKIGLSLSDYWLIIRKRKWVAILCFSVIFLSVVFNTYRQTPIYKSTCSIRIVERKSVTDMVTAMVTWTSYDLMSSIPQVLRSRSIIERVIYELGWADENTPLEKLNKLILGLQGAIETEHEEGTNIINISMVGDNPQAIADVCNTVAEVYIKADMDEKNEQAHKMRIFIEEQLTKANQRLTDAEDKLKAFREAGEVTGIGVILQNNIAALEKEKIDLRKIYTEKYPDVIKINEQIENLKERVQALPEGELEYARLTREREVNERSYLLLKSKLDEARIAEAERVEDVKIVNPAIVPKRPIKPKKELATVMGLIIGLAMGVFMAFTVETLDTSIGTIDDLETLLKLPVLAVIPYMRIEDTEKKKWHQWLRLPLRLKPREKSTRRKKEAIEGMRQQLLIKYPQRSSTTEAYRILRTNIKVEELLKTDKRILLVTSTIPREGKSITALNLSLALAQDGYRILLIDCDLRKALLHKIFHIDKEPGLTNILLGTHKPEEAIRNLVDIMMGDISIIDDPSKMPGLDNFNLLPCGKIVTNPAEVLDSKEVKTLFSNLKTQYDFLMIDSPPVLPVPDTIILGTKVAEKLYLVYRAGYTSRIAILRAKEQLDMMKTVPSGVILNSTTPESQLVSDYYHHYYHYRYYTEAGEEEKEKEIR